MARIEVDMGIPSTYVVGDARKPLLGDDNPFKDLLPTDRPNHVPEATLEEERPAPKSNRRMPSTHRSILFRDLQGQLPQTIAEALGLSETSIRRVMNSPIYKGERARIMETSEEKIKRSKERLVDLQERALEIAEDLMENEDPRVQTIMVKDILDRSGLKPMERRRTEVFDAARMIEAAYKSRSATSGKSNGGNNPSD